MVLGFVIMVRVLARRQGFNPRLIHAKDSKKHSVILGIDQGEVDWLVVWVLWHINLCRLFNAKSIFMKIVLFQTIQFTMSTQFVKEHFYFKQFSLG